MRRFLSGSRTCANMPFRFTVTTLRPSASFAEAFNVHWREYLMESAQVGTLYVLHLLLCDAPLRH